MLLLFLATFQIRCQSVQFKILATQVLDFWPGRLGWKCTLITLDTLDTLDTVQFDIRPGFHAESKPTLYPRRTWAQRRPCASSPVKRANVKRACYITNILLPSYFLLVLHLLHHVTSPLILLLSFSIVFRHWHQARPVKDLPAACLEGCSLVLVTAGLALSTGNTGSTGSTRNGEPHICDIRTWHTWLEWHEKHGDLQIKGVGKRYALIIYRNCRNQGGRTSKTIPHYLPMLTAFPILHGLYIVFKYYDS